MEPWQKEIISNNLDTLVDFTHLSASLYANLCSKRLLETSEIWELEAEKNVGVRNRRFYEIILEKPQQSSFDALISAFSESKQTAVTTLLMNATTHRNQPRDGTNEQKISDPGMEEWQREHIRANLVALCERTSLNIILLIFLRSEAVLDQTDIWAMEAESNQMMKCLKFYDIIQSKGNNAYKKLIDALEQCAMSGASSILKAAKNPAS